MTSGYNRLSSGENNFDSFSISPQSLAILMNPDHMINIPLIEISSSIADPAASGIPVLICSMLPLNTA